MTNDKTVRGLLDLWAYFLNQGVEYSAEQVCAARGHLELQEELAEVIRKWKAACPPTAEGCCE